MSRFRWTLVLITLIAASSSIANAQGGHPAETHPGCWAFPLMVVARAEALKTTGQNVVYCDFDADADCDEHDLETITQIFLSPYDEVRQCFAYSN